MNWYQKLSNYFPENEMKDKAQMNELLEKHDAYKKIETEEYLIMYAEFPDFFFVDYFLVHPSTRGKGIGSKAINQLKKHEKMIVLEVEPPLETEEDTVKRVHFYEKNGFKKAEHIVYEREDDTGKTFEMSIYYWSPETTSEHEVFGNMARVCREIHNFKSKKYYDRIIADPDSVLDWK